MVTRDDFCFLNAVPEEDRQRFDAAFRLFSHGVSESLRFFLRFVVEAAERVSGSNDEGNHMVPFLTMFEYAEAVDGVSLLLKYGSVKNVYPLMRQALETSWVLRYLTETQEVYARRTAAYEYWHLQDELKSAKKHDSAKVASIEASIASDRYEDVKAEETRTLDALKARTEARTEGRRKSKVDKWHALWQGPGNVEQLASRVDQAADYAAYYHLWSVSAHGDAAIQRLVRHSGEKRVIPHRLRTPVGLYAVATAAMRITVALGKHLVEFYLPERSSEAELHLSQHVDRLYPLLDRQKHL